MSAISNFLNKIKTAVYGEEVRGAIHDAIEQCYTDVTNAKTLADGAADNANTKAAAANSAADNANTKASAANTAAENANTKASLANTKATAANTAATAANSAATAANNAANAANAAASVISDLEVSATKLAAGANPTATFSYENKTLNFGIPKGDKGTTGATPNIQIGTVNTVNPDQAAAVRLASGSTAAKPIFDFDIPKGNTGSVTNVYGSSIPMSESNPTTIASKINSLETDLSSANSRVNGLETDISNNKVVVVDCGTLSSLPTTIENSDITEKHVAVNYEVNSPYAIKSGITVTTANGSITISGTLSDSTTLKLYFAVSK